jgi:hypothetical protein
MSDCLDWLLSSAEPGVRYLALRDLQRPPTDDPRLCAARLEALREGPIAQVLEGMHPEGYWERPGPGYNPKYTSTVWALILLAQLGADVEMDQRIPRACAYLLDHALAQAGQFSYNGAPGGTIDCLQGNLAWALTALGYHDPRLDLAYDWMARSVTGEGIAPLGNKDTPERYYAYKCGPLFACGANFSHPCAWGGAKVLLAFSVLPEERRTPRIRQAIQLGAEYFLSIDPASGAYPAGPDGLGKPSGNWWKFGFPVFYITDLLQVVEALAGLGYGQDPRLTSVLDLVRSKQDTCGRWAMEFSYEDKTWGSYGAKKQPNPWVTLRALRALQNAGVTSS